MACGTTAMAAPTAYDHDLAGHLTNRAVAVSAAPTILSHPQDQLLSPGQAAVFSVVANGSAPLAYRWQREGVNVSGGVGDSLTVTSEASTTSAVFRAIVSNPLGSVTSRTARLHVDADGDDLPDFWEKKYFGNTTAQAGWGDADSDGVRNKEEWQDGTLPNVSTSRWYRLSIACYGSGHAYAEPAQDRYAPGSTVALVAVPFGTVFSGWSWPAGATALRQPLVMDRNVETLALFGVTSGQVIGWGGYGAADNAHLNLPADLTNAIALDVAGYSCMALRANGRVSCWGDPWNNGGTNVPAGVTNAVAIAKGGFGNVALRADGTLAGTGYSASYVGSLSNVVAVAVGSTHLATLQADGTVVVKGYDNYYGQLNVPPDLANVVAIAADSRYTLAVKSNGKAVPWGWHNYAAVTVPAGVSNVVAASASYMHQLYLKADGTVAAGGDNGSGQGRVPAGLSDVVGLSAGDYHSAALKADGSVSAWGSNSGFALDVPQRLVNGSALAAGANCNMAIISAPGVPAIGWMTAYRAIAGNTVTVCGTRFTGTTSVRLGDASVPFAVLDDRRIAVTVPAGLENRLCKVEIRNGAGVALAPRLFVVGDDTPPTGILCAPATVVEHAPTNTLVGVLRGQDADLGETFAYALVSGAGDTDNARFRIVNDVGVRTAAAFDYETQPSCSIRVRATDSQGRSVEQSLAVTVTNILTDDDDGDTLTEAQELAVGSNPLVTDTDGDGWWDNLESSGGTVATNALRHPAGMVVAWGNNTDGQCNVPAGLTNVVALGVGDWHTLAVKADGRLTAWGWNTSGQATSPASLTNAVAAAGGYYHSVALRLNGRVTAWGNNGDGQTNVPAGLANAVGIGAGNYHSLAVKADGRVAGWGFNNYGQATPPVDLTNAVAVSAGYYHSLALRANGRVRGWGWNNYGQTNAPANLTNAVAIASGYYHNLALRADGTVYAWGYNGNGQTTVPAGLSNVVAIGAGNYHSLAVKADGSLVTWGYGVNGETNRPAWALGGVALNGGAKHSAELVAPRAPAIGWMSAYSGAPGTAIRLYGTRFTGATQVHVNGRSAMFTVDSDTRVSVTLPPGMSELGRVEVRNAEGATYAPRLFVAVVPADTDRDGIPDDWELAHGLNPAVSNAPAANVDGDAQTDWEEYVANTSPTNPLSFFEVPPDGLGMQGDLLTITLDPTSLERVYDLEWKTNLMQSWPTWTPFGLDRLGTGGPLVLSVTNARPMIYVRPSVRLP